MRERLFPIPLALLLVPLFALAGLAGCTYVAGPPSVRLALEGPPLFIRGVQENEGEERHFAGYMDRSCMAGIGQIALSDMRSGFFCQGDMDSLPSEKARLHAELLCSDGTSLHLLLRNVGPDQGIGVGRFEAVKAPLELFYHPSEGEAVRRLARFRADLARASGEARQGSDAETDGAGGLPGTL